MQQVNEQENKNSACVICKYYYNEPKECSEECKEIRARFEAEELAKHKPTNKMVRQTTQDIVTLMKNSCYNITNNK